MLLWKIKSLIFNRTKSGYTKSFFLVSDKKLATFSRNILNYLSNFKKSKTAPKTQNS